MHPKLKPLLLAAVIPVSMDAAVTWNDTGTNFNDASSWAGGLPDSSTVGILPLDATIANQPNLSGSISVGGLEFGGAGYTISGGANVLTVGSSGISSIGEGTNLIATALATSAGSSAMWNIDAANTLTLSGAFTAGSGSTVTKTGAGTLNLSGTSGMLASTLKIQGGKVIATTAALSSAIELSNGAQLDIAFIGVGVNITAPLVLGVGGGILSNTPPSSASSRIDINFSGSGDLELQGNTYASRFLQINSASSRASTNTGKTVISAGAVRISGGFSIGDTSLVEVKSGAELQVRTSETIGGLQGGGTVSSVGGISVVTTGAGNGSDVFSGVLRDEPTASLNTLGLVKEGVGSQTLSGNANTYSGGTTVNAGTLIVANASGSATGTGAVAVKGGASLIGNGRITGAVSIESGGLLAAGSGDAASGVLTLVGNVTLGDNSTIQISLGAGSHSSLIAAGGSWTFDSDQSFSFLSFDAAEGTYAGIITGLTGPVDTTAWKIANSGWSGSFSYNASTSSIDFHLAAVPEPSVTDFLLMGAGALFLFRTRRA